MDRPIFPVDRDLPELGVATNPTHMVQLFSTYLGAARTPVAIEDCRIARLRYRPHQRCVVQYSLMVREGAICTRHWVTGSMYAERGRAERTAIAEATAGNAFPVDSPLLPVAFIPELRMTVNVFPHDRKLPQAARLLRERDPSVEAEVQRRLGGSDWAITSWKAEPVRYREHLALVLRYTVEGRNLDTNEATERIFYLKAYPNPDEARLAFTHVCGLARYAEESPPGVRIDMPLAWLAELNAVLIERTSGRPLDAIVRAGFGPDVVEAVRETARALAGFNRSAAPMRRRYRAFDHVTAVERATTLLRYACPDLDRQLSAVVRSLAGNASDADAHPTHRDMKLEHVLLGPEGPAFIDLDSSAAADPVIDPALMAARLTAAAFNAPDRSVLERASDAFLSEYFAAVPETWRHRLPSYYAAALVEVAAGVFHRQEPCWREHVARLVDTASCVAVGATS